MLRLPGLCCKTPIYPGFSLTSSEQSLRTTWEAASWPWSPQKVRQIKYNSQRLGCVIFFSLQDNSSKNLLTQVVCSTTGPQISGTWSARGTGCSVCVGLCGSHNISTSPCVGSIKTGLHEDPRDRPGLCVHKVLLALLPITTCYISWYFLEYPESAIWPSSPFLSQAISWVAGQPVAFGIKFLAFGIRCHPGAISCMRWVLVTLSAQAVGGAVLLRNVCKSDGQYTWRDKP